MSPNAEIAAVLFSLIFSFVITLYVFIYSPELFLRLSGYLLAMVSCNRSAS